jgi:sucrose-6-phosphate hydrolase SacC (GH32 family)
VRLFARPVDEISLLHQQWFGLVAQPLVDGAPARLLIDGELFDVRAAFEIGDAAQVGLDIGGNRIVYDVAEQRLGDATLPPVDGTISLQVIVDRNMLEICGNDGRVFITAEREELGDFDAIEAFAQGGEARLTKLSAFQLESIWKGRQ